MQYPTQSTSPVNFGGQRHLGIFGVPGALRPKREPAVVVTPPTGYGQSGKSLDRREAALASLTQVDRAKAYFARQDAAKRLADAIRDTGLFEDEPRATGAQNMVAAASDAREGFPSIINDEHAEFLHRCQGAGFVEMNLATES